MKYQICVWILCPRHTSPFRYARTKLRRKICVSYPCSPSKTRSPSPNQPRAVVQEILRLLSNEEGQIWYVILNLFSDQWMQGYFRESFGTSLQIGITFISWELWRQTKRWSFCVKWIYIYRYSIFFEMLLDIQPQLRSVSLRLCSLGRWRTPKMNHAACGMRTWSCSYH